MLFLHFMWILLYFYFWALTIWGCWKKKKRFKAKKPGTILSVATPAQRLPGNRSSIQLCSKLTGSASIVAQCVTRLCTVRRHRERVVTAGLGFESCTLGFFLRNPSDLGGEVACSEEQAGVGVTALTSITLINMRTRRQIVGYAESGSCLVYPQTSLTALNIIGICGFIALWWHWTFWLRARPSITLPAIPVMGRDLYS